MKFRTISDAMSKAQTFIDAGDEEKAYECYKAALELDAYNIDVIHKLAETAQMLQYNNDAINYWNMFMQLKPDDALPYTQLLDLYFHDNKYEYYMTRGKLKTIEGRIAQSTDDYKKAINNTTEEKEIITARYLLAQSFEFIGKPLAAIDEYLKILDYEPNEAVYISLANLYYQEDKSAALDMLLKALNEYPDSNAVKEFLCKVYLALGEYAKAEQYAVSLFNKIKSMLMQEKNESALDLLKTVSEQDKQDISYSALMAEYYYNVNDKDNALKWIDILEQQNPDSPLPFQMRALLYEKLNDDFNAHFNWGKYYSKKSQHDLAQDEYLNAYHEDTLNVDIIKALINHYSSIEDKFACAEFCEKLVAIEKDDIATLKKLVKFYEEQGYEDKVLDYLYQLSECNERDYETLLKLARHAQKSRKIDDAIEYYQKYMKFAPNTDEKEQAQVQLNLLTSGNIGADEEGLLDKIIRFFTKK